MADPILVVLFLRGGADGLNLVAPTADKDYIAARPRRLRVLRKGDEAGLTLENPVADVDFRFHAQARGLAELYDAGELAVVHAAGLTDGTRSHFDAEDRIERAAPAAQSGGWLGRWLETARPEGILPALAVGSAMPESMSGASNVAVAEEMEQLILASGYDISRLLRQRLQAGFGAHPILAAPIRNLIGLGEALEKRLWDSKTQALGKYVPNVDYPENNDLARSLMTLAQAIKLDIGLRVATVDFDGWDTHFDQADDFARQTDSLSSALMAFWRDLRHRRDDTCVVVMSEFGRRLRANRSGGTDHGHGNAMMVLGGTVRGRRMLGHWPGLANDALNDGADLAITTDYRHILAEVMARHMQTPDLADLFPGFQPDFRGLFA